MNGRLLHRRLLLSAVGTMAALHRPASAAARQETLPAETLTLLNGIQFGTPISRSFANASEPPARTLGGNLFFRSRLELASESASNSRDIPSSRAARLHYADGSEIDGREIPYIALPGPPDWLFDFGIQLGDFAAVIVRDTLAFAVFGAFSEVNRLGRCSTELFRLLRQRDPDADRGRYLPREIACLVFPRSGSHLNLKDAATLKEAIATKGLHFFALAGGQPNAGGIVAEQRRGPAQRVRILWVDDLPENNVIEASILRRQGIEVSAAGSSAEAHQKLAGGQWDLVISDIDREGRSDEGLRFLADLRRAGRTIPVIFYSSSYSTERYAGRLRQLDAIAVSGAAELLGLVDRSIP
ncbi:response regulator [Teichococcus vastitatis]|uniref:Response regulator n=1 Tax=Teichococcus vastitatis TaxID=2307076 RepID=A0ABS9VYV6_9PROT|nr:response regulator [Pseudoroseomonas vastitatis]MCI0752149.1 response regulator [Pseudoroseomonas vastitatis]